jgi:hypothetical protein
MEVVMPVRRKRKRAPESTTAPESAPVESAPAESAPAESAPVESTSAPATRGLLRKGALRRFLKREFAFPLQVREAFFAAMEAKVSEDLRRSVARARELKRSTLMAPDA